MPHINEMKGPSKYLEKKDIGRGALVTIKSIEPRMIENDNGSKDSKWLMYFNEGLKPLILNMTNVQLAARACGSEDTDDWTGKQIVLFVDPNVSYQGKLVGGIRIRAPKPQAVAPVVAQKQAIVAAAAKWTKSHAMPAAEPESVEEMLEEDQIPF